MFNIKFDRARAKGITLGAFIFLIFLNGAFADDPALTRRFGIFIGSNDGGRDRIMLRYAVSDAKSLSRVFAIMGGIAPEDNFLLVEPSVAEINRQLSNLGRLSAEAKRNAQRTELVFYYSGHSDEDGVFLNRERYSYRELRERINTVQADMRIVILDSCASGAITRAKGGVKTQPFLFDSSVSAEGYAFLTSSSADETSQESDKIESSYFTHSILAGLRGAADSAGDGRVTLNELYRFAYNETLAKTETSIYGAQHPSYDIQISGSGDVVLTDIKEISASLLFTGEISGRISIRDSSDFLVAELTKISGKALELGLEPGLYRITLQQGDNFYRVEITLPENKRTILGMGEFSLIAGSSGDRRRGDYTEEDTDVPYHPFNIQPFPGFNVVGHFNDKATNNVLFGLFVGLGHNIMGIGVASIGLINTGYIYGIQTAGVFNTAGGEVHGIQAAGVFNTAGGEVHGIQAAGIFNTAGGEVHGQQAAGIFNTAGGEVHGLQAAGIFNVAGGDVHGLQASGIYNKAGMLHGAQAAPVNVNEGGQGVMFGIVNLSESEDILPFGIVNVMKNGIMCPAVFIDDMLFTNISFRSGSKHFYTFLSAGIGGGFTFGSGDRLFTYRCGFGYEYRINKFFLNIDIIGGSIINIDTITLSPDWSKPAGQRFEEASDSITGISQLRLIAGYRVFPHLGVFGGVSFDYLYRNKETSPDIRDFGGPLIGASYGLHTFKMGFFGGIQF